MDIGIGIPNAVRTATGAQLLEWARAAESAGFSSLATIGAVSYPSHEELTVLAAAAAVTQRIGLLSNVLVAPARSTAELAKQAATVQELSGGRLTLGLGVGWRETDYALTERSFTDRGRRFDEQLEGLRRAWAGQPLLDGTKPVAPSTGAPREIPLLIGGMTPAAVRRVVRYGVGWTAGGAPPDMTRSFIENVRRAWRDADREGAPRIVALAYFALGDVDEEARANVRDYYEVSGPEMAEMIAGSVLLTPDAIGDAIKTFADIGVDEFILTPAVSAVDQVRALADVAL